MNDSFLFPYEAIRPEQNTLIADVQEALEKGKHLLAHAPTGLGKTVAVLGPALKYAEEHNKKVFFLTSRHTQHVLAVQTLRDIKKAFNKEVVCCDLIAKKWMCCQPGAEQMPAGEFHEYCKALRNDNICDFYSNMRLKGKVSPRAVHALTQITTNSPADTKMINTVSKEQKVCPYEMASLLAKDARVVIADYNYIFNDRIREGFFVRSNTVIDDCILIIDEGHNLPQRCREMLTAKLNTFVLSRAIKEAKKFGYDDQKEQLEKMMKILEDLGSELTPEKDEDYVLKGEFVKPLSEYEQIMETMTNVGDAIREEQRSSFIGSVAQFMEAWPGPERGFCRTIKVSENKYGKQLTLSYRCLDPSLISAPVLEDCSSAILMSGTLAPAEMYADILGFRQFKVKEYKDPFSEKNRLRLIVDDVTTKFTARNPEQYRNIARISAEIVNAVPGNSIVFFPSYALRNQVKSFFDRLCEKTVFTEQSGLSKEEKAQLLDTFKGYEKTGAVMLAVTGGSFGEGVDLPGDLLKCVVVVGVPLGKPDLETRELIEYYEDKYGEGMNYGYIYPAITKTMQNAGRCIRSEEDRGVIVFMDTRYTWENYAKCFPPDWKMQITKQWKERIGKFFTV